MEASALPILTESNLTTPDPSTPKRKRGGQKDNKKALKLGFYARHLRPSEIRDLQEISTTSLQEEIAMARWLEEHQDSLVGAFLNRDETPGAEAKR